jgi:hypothetical protein
MDAVSPAFSFVLVMLAGWMNRHQQQVIEYLKAENRMLKAKLRPKRRRAVGPGKLTESRSS